MYNNKQTIQEWNLYFLEEHLEKISSQNESKTIHEISLVDQEDINIAYEYLTMPENIKLIQNGKYPIIKVKDIFWNDLKSKCFDCESKETRNNYIVEINHFKSEAIINEFDNPKINLEYSYKNIITFDKNKYFIHFERQTKPKGSDTIQPTTKYTYIKINNKKIKTEWERLVNKKKENYTIDDEFFIRSILKPSKILNSAIKNNYFYDHWIYSPKGKDFIRIEVGSVIHYSYANINEKGETKYRINVYTTPEEIKIYKDLYSNNSKKYEQHYYNSYEEFYDDVAILKEDAELLQVLENDIRKIEELQLCASFNGQNKEKARQKVYNN